MKRMLVIGVLVLFVGSMAEAAVKAGDNELILAGSYTNIKNDNGHSSEATSAMVNVGHFFTDNIELGIVGDAGLTSDDKIYAAGVNGRFHFMTDAPVIPYVGGFAEYGYNDHTPSNRDHSHNDGLVYGPLGGLRFFVNETTDIFLEYQIQYYSGNLGDNLDNTQKLVLGISFKW